MDAKLLKILKKVTSEITGVNTEKLITILYGKQKVNEFLIAKKLKSTINQTRNILYKLADKDLVEFIKKKDSKKGGWYTYFWTLKTKKVLQVYKEETEKKIQELDVKIKNLNLMRVFYCPECNTEYNEENAIVNEFTCTECGKVLQIKDGAKFVAESEKEREKLKLSLTEIEKEIENIEEKEKNLLERKMKRELKKRKGKKEVAKKSKKTKKKIKKPKNKKLRKK